LRGDILKRGIRLVDILLIQRKLTELEGYLKQIKEYQDISISDYRRQWKVQRIVERTLHLMIEACIDIANHVVSDKGLRPPVSYADTFLVLEEAGIINKALSSRLQKMARFRNIIVHRYEEIEPEIIISILRKNLKDFDLFKKSILQFLNRT
jgi:uncharacterized protein YutE (UPF0331/DUF86 family)